MKKIILTLLFGVPIFLFSQNYKELDSSSAGNVYYSTNKKFFITEYLTEPQHRFVLFFKDTTDYNYLYFSSKEEISGFILIALRSIEKKKDIIYKTETKEFTIISVTKNISNVRVGDDIFSIDKSTLNQMISKFQKI